SGEAATSWPVTSFSSTTAICFALDGSMMLRSRPPWLATRRKGPALRLDWLRDWAGAYTRSTNRHIPHDKYVKHCLLITHAVYHSLRHSRGNVDWPALGPINWAARRPPACDRNNPSSNRSIRVTAAFAMKAQP